jgi:PAS domain S-box-containing protein
MKRFFLLFLMFLVIQGICAPSVFARRDRNAIVFIVHDARLPYFVRDAGGSINGFDVEVVQALAQELGRPYEIRVADKDETIKLINAGEADVVVGIVQTNELESTYDFSSAFLVDMLRIYALKDTTFIHTLRDLSGLRVGVGESKNVADFLKIMPGVRLTLEPDEASGLWDLLDNRIKVYLGDEHECRYHLRINQITDIKTVGGPLHTRKRVFAVKKGNKELLMKINTALEEKIRPNRLPLIYQRWFGPTELAAETKRRFLVLFLAVIWFSAVILLVALIWNQRLAAAVTSRTQELRIEHQHFQNIFDHASDGIVVLDPQDTLIIETNAAFAEILGYSKEELSDIRLKDLDMSEDKRFVANIQSVLDVAGEDRLFEAKLRGHHNQVVDLSIHARTLPYRGRQMVEAIAHDVTQKRKLEVMKETILQDMAHELKTPLSKVAMSLDLVERSIQPKAVKQHAKFFNICRLSIDRLQSTIEGILNLSRLESHAFKVSQDAFPIQDVLHLVMDELQIFAQNKGIQLARHLPEDPLLMKGDIEMIRRLFINIVHNAIKFTDKGTVTITACQDGKWIAVTAQDQGIGLEPTDLKKIFGRFYQKVPVSEGCGIGLTIAQKIVLLHNGQIKVESSGLGKGTTFHLRFPLHKAL